LKVRDFINHYKNDVNTSSLTEILKPNNQSKIQVKGLSGSLDAAIASAISTSQVHQSHLLIMHDREEAAYFLNDMQNLMGNKQEIYFFPASYKRPYEFEETENANVLLRTELINKLNNKTTAG
jgi:transcription-repair coupling factor (superfamily II helicase)